MIKAFPFGCIFLCFCIVFISCQAEVNKEGDNYTTGTIKTAYYISNNGDDSNDGSKAHPWKNISKIASVPLNAGDSVLLQGSQTFTGTLAINYNSNGTNTKPIIITSYNGGTATINSSTEKGLVINNSSYITVQNIKLVGAGRKAGNVTSGVTVAYCKYIRLDNIDISGYQKSGLLIRNCSDMKITNISAHDNGYAGISVDGENFLKSDCRDIDISYCRAENNPGDPTKKDNHSGNGIIVSQCTNTKISYCTATNNGWDMPRTGNGPVGIWAWEADSVTIEHCLSYQNKTSVGGQDGGGFDFDGGVTNSVIQYCLSYENQGSGIGLFQYNNASPWENNVVRYNISINDGNVSAAKAGIFIWNLSLTNNLKNCAIYNNTFYNNKNAALSYSTVTNNENIVFYNNILVGNTAIILGKDSISKYYGNCWYSLTNGFNVEGITNFDTWRNQYKQETLNTVKVGLNADPVFSTINPLTITDAKMILSFLNAKGSNVNLLNSGIDLLQQFNIKADKDFNGNAAKLKSVGASF